MIEAIEKLDLAAWVAKAPSDKRNFREAVQIILTAIGTSTALRTKMVMKGGMLMALRYESSRFTKDADFSTKALYVKGDEKQLLEELDAQLALANAETYYDTIAPRSNERALQRLLAKQSPNVVEIDHSYNEAVLDVEVLNGPNRRSGMRWKSAMEAGVTLGTATCAPRRRFRPPFGIRVAIP